MDGVDMYKIEPMTFKKAEIISTWKYPDEYAIYSFENSENTISELMNGDYFSCISTQGNLIGYFCFGRSAQIPTETNYTLDIDKKDIGLGLSPELCGHGYGKDFMQSGIEYAKMKFEVSGLRLVVAEFNKRAISLYQNCGFLKMNDVEHKKTKTIFTVMQCTL